jgi:23S rRNA C2498 (ribose-2'-O)-methylase RlmM
MNAPHHTETRIKRSVVAVLWGACSNPTGFPYITMSQTVMIASTNSIQRSLSVPNTGTVAHFHVTVFFFHDI